MLTFSFLSVLFVLLFCSHKFVVLGELIAMPYSSITRVATLSRTRCQNRHAKTYTLFEFPFLVDILLVLLRFYLFRDPSLWKLMCALCFSSVLSVLPGALLQTNMPTLLLDELRWRKYSFQKMFFLFYLTVSFCYVATVLLWFWFYGHCVYYFLLCLWQSSFKVK